MTADQSAEPDKDSPSPLEPVPMEPVPPPERRTRAGRNLPAAIAVGLTLGALILVTLYVWKPAFLGVKPPSAVPHDLERVIPVAFFLPSRPRCIFSFFP